MSALLVGYARCSTDQQDLTAQRDGLLTLGFEAERIYVDHGLTGTNRERPGLREALAACRAGDTLVVTKLERLARSLPDARAIADELTSRQISLSLSGSVYDPTDAVGRLLSNVLAIVPEFESDLTGSTPANLKPRQVHHAGLVEGPGPPGSGTGRCRVRPRRPRRRPRPDHAVGCSSPRRANGQPRDRSARPLVAAIEHHSTVHVPRHRPLLLVNCP